MIKATLIDYMGSDLSVVNAARVSFGTKHEVFNEKKDAKLINFLARNNHVSPFGHAFASFHVSAPIFIARQLVKHKFLRWNEISRRYVSNEPKLYEPTTWRGKAFDKKQGSSDTVVIEGVEIRATQSYDISLYKHLLEMGICEEQATIVLPANLMTEWYWSGSLDAFADMCKLRCTKDTQNETKIIADEISDIMKRLYPVSWEALTDSK
ncbi:FAD-dependent thymidylate synthase [Planktomarina temperata]|nr:FAD-dependent thymidylate synthase [Planktomarina temperata]